VEELVAVDVAEEDSATGLGGIFLEPRDAVRAYDGRYQMEVNIDEVQELGLEHYHGRSGQGVRRGPLLLCLGQMILKFIATRVLPVELPELHWSW